MIMAMLLMTMLMSMFIFTTCIVLGLLTVACVVTGVARTQYIRCPQHCAEEQYNNDGNQQPSVRNNRTYY